MCHQIYTIKKSEHNYNNTYLIIIASLPEISVCTTNGCKSSIIAEWEANEPVYQATFTSVAQFRY